MDRQKISTAVISRLPRYYRTITEFQEKGKVRTSSKELSEKMGLTASQIRQDFNCFGGFGQQGYGYNVPQLRKELGEILGLNKSKKTIVIGAGNIARAILNDFDFKRLGFNVVAIFDKNPALTGQLIKGVPIRHIDMLDEFYKENPVSVAVICTPKSTVPEIAHQLVSLGIKGIWNFSHYDLSPEIQGVAVENVHLKDSLMSLSYKLTEK
jgi:redox-sensing transcriptional repressor